GITSTLISSPIDNPVSVIVNTEGTFQCQTSPGNPVASVVWYKDNKTTSTADDIQITSGTSTSSTPDGDLIVTHGTLTLQVQRDDQDLDGPDPPVCKANNVNVSPSLIVIIGSMFSISCTADSNPLPTTYLLSGPDGINLPLSFTGITRTQAGSYTVEARNNLPWMPTIRVDGSTVKGMVNIIEGNSKVFNCSTDSNPASSYSWTYPHPPLLPIFKYGTSGGPDISDNTIAIVGGLGATVACVAHSKPAPSIYFPSINLYMDWSNCITVGHLQYYWRSFHQPASVLLGRKLYADDLQWNSARDAVSRSPHGPKTKILQDLSLVRGDMLVFPCLYAPGNPPAVSFEWTRSGTSASWVKQNTQNLTIEYVQRSDEASYTCKVSSVLRPTLTSATTVQYDTATFHLDVLYGAENLILQLNNESHLSVEIEEHSTNHMRCSLESDPGSYMVISKDGSARRPPEVNVKLIYNARQHENATLVYQIVAYPEPKPSQFVWKRCMNTSCAPLPNDIKKFKIDTEGLSSNLTVLDVQIEDYIIYQLSVFNGVGDSLVERFHLRPTGKPDLPTDVHIIQDTITDRTAVLTWIPGIDNGSPQEFHVSYRKLVDETSLVRLIIKHDYTKEMYYKIENLEPGTKYLVSLFAANEEGSTALVNDTFETLERISDYPVNNPNTGSIVGGAIGGTVGAIVAIVVIVVILRRQYLLKCYICPNKKSDLVQTTPDLTQLRHTRTVPWQQAHRFTMSDNSHVYMTLNESSQKPQGNYENVKKEDPVYNNAVQTNPHINQQFIDEEIIGKREEIGCMDIRISTVYVVVSKIHKKSYEEQNI
ncbi:hypothetical protein MAR_018998, partial [Mya arenaria]